MAGTGFLSGITESTTTATLTVGDIEIGAVELKNASTDDRAKVATTATIVEGDIAIAMHDPVLGATTGAAILWDTNGFIQQYLRGLIKMAAGRKLGTGGDVLDINADGDRSIQLSAGLWRLAPNRDIWYKQGTIAVAAAKDTAESHYLAGGAIELIPVTGTNDDYVHVIAGEDPTAGKASITKEL